MYSSIFFSLYTNDLLKKKARIVLQKTCFQRGFEFKKKYVICKEKIYL